ncbi:tetratricopeptide repeat protein [Streptomyces bacillaris]
MAHRTPPRPPPPGPPRPEHTSQLHHRTQHPGRSRRRPQSCRSSIRGTAPAPARPGPRVHRPGPGHPDTLISRNNLASALHALGEHRRAADLHQQVLTDTERTLGPDHPHTLTSRHNLAVALNDLGEHRQAADLHQQVLTDRERVLGPDHPDTLTSRNSLAIVRARLAQAGRRRWWQLPRRGGGA